MRDEEQVKPLAPEAHRININNNINNTVVPPIKSHTKLHKQKFVNCCACAAVAFVLLGVIILVLMLTVFKVKDPKLTLNYMTVKGLEGVNPLNPFPNVNLTFVADISIKNPNAASFKFHNATTRLYYESVLIGEVRTPQGIAKARRTFKLMATIDFMLQDIIRVPRFLGDLMAGSLTVSSQTSIRGKVEVIKIIKKNVGVRMDCTFKYSVTKQELEDRTCKKYVSL